MSSPTISIGLGEDGPTHQPVEHLAALRAIPNLYLLRPADSVETVECWQTALERPHSPSILALTRQSLPALRRTHVAENLCAKGAYELSPADGPAAVSIFALGSEVSIAVAAQVQLKGRGIAARVVSIPCMENLRPVGGLSPFGDRLGQGESRRRGGRPPGLGRNYRRLTRPLPFCSKSGAGSMCQGSLLLPFSPSIGR